MRLRGRAALPQADQPQPGEAPARQDVQLFVRDLVQRRDRAPVLLGELVQPDVGVLGDQHQAGHPVPVGAELLRLQLQPGKLVDQCRSRSRRRRLFPPP